MVKTLVNVAVTKEFLDAVVGRFVLHIGPMSDIELLINGEAPFICEIANATFVSLRSHVFTV